MQREPAETTLTTFTAGDGGNLAVQDWPLPEGVAPRGTVLLVHGLGEHAGRHQRLARRLNEWGFAARGYDHWGHGESGGARGALPQNDRLVRDLQDIAASTRSRMAAGEPLVLFGHSLGGLVAASAVAGGHVAVDALVLSSPAFDGGFSPVQRALLAVLPRLVPNLRVGNGLDADFLSHDEAVVRAYRADPLVHDRIAARLARFIAQEGPRVIAAAPRWRVPTLLLYAGDDRLVNPAGSRAFAQAAPRDVVTSRGFEGLYHEIFNERDAEPVFAALRGWLDAQASGWNSRR